ncbi:hypothetical protein [Kitasatospora sp. LaBMicrA B282]|uniref:hypothetical protein n=1 Tax=Kitasatospora sp. LaBMicrA B282 TaxID=3420949 RepID=UPI003D13C113
MVNDPGTAPISDLQTLRAMTHPLRWRLYELLLTNGPSTASRLGQIVGATPGHLSYHLHELAKYGYATEAPELQQDGRERWWKAVAGGIRWSSDSLPDTEAGREAERRIEQLMFNRQHERLQAWWDHRKEAPEAWQHAAFSTDAVASLTSGELEQMAQELQAVISKWCSHGRQAEDSGDRRPVFVFAHAFKECT